MIARIILERLAEEDIDAIAAFIAARDAQAAALFVRRLRQRLRTLGLFPSKGKLRSELAPGVRTTAFDRRAVIAYRAAGDEVRILRVFYAGQDFEDAIRSSFRDD